MRFQVVSLIKPEKLYVSHWLADGRVQVFLAGKVEHIDPESQDPQS